MRGKYAFKPKQHTPHQIHRPNFDSFAWIFHVAQFRKAACYVCMFTTEVNEFIPVAGTAAP